MTTTEVQEPGRGLSRPVLLAGITAGTALLVTAYWDGWRPRIPALQPVLGIALGAVVVWLLFTGLATVAAELLRRHHRTLAARAWRHGKRGTIAAARGTRHGGRAATAYLAGKAGPRWQARGQAVRAPLFVTHRRPPSDDSGGQDQTATSGMGWATPEATAARQARERLDDRQCERDANGQQNICAACGHPASPKDPLVVDDGFRIHQSHTTGPATTGTHRPAGAPAPAVTSRNGDKPMATTAATPIGSANAPGQWKALASSTADFEPADESELLEWMACEVSGALGYGEALADVHEHCVTAVRLDPAAMAALHDVADAAADMAEAMARAREKFMQVYEGPREFVSEGGVLPRDGDFITGDDDA